MPLDPIEPADSIELGSNFAIGSPPDTRQTHSSQTKLLGDSGQSSPRLQASDRANSESPPEGERAKPSTASWWSSVSSDTWFYELFAIGFSLACFVSIICILRFYNNKTSPQLSYGLTLNTIISVLSTACKTSLVFLVGEAIGQLKWSWFHQRHRPLNDLQSFDNASRGPLGSLTLLFQHRGLSLVSLGAMITVLALALDPFMQQILSYPIRSRSIETPSASAKQSLAFVNGTDDFDVRSAVNTGLWSTGFQVDPGCPMGNCTWPIYRSIEWCSQCEDVTNDTKLECPDPGFNTSVMSVPHYFKPEAVVCNVTLPDGLSAPLHLELFVDTADGPTLNVPSNRVWSLTPNLGGTYGGLKDPLLVVSHVTLDYPDNIRLPLWATAQNLTLTKATECTLTLCARTYDTTVSNGKTFLEVTSVEYGSFYLHHETTSTGIYFHQCWQAGNGPPVNFTRAQFEDPTKLVVNATALAFCPTPFVDGLLSQLDGARNYTQGYIGNWWQEPHKAPADAVERVLKTGLPTIMSNIAASLTKLALDRSGHTINGNMSHAEVQVAVDWSWITLPAVVLAAGIVFLASVVVVNRHERLGLWKSSVFPVLYHGLDENLLPDVGEDATTVSQMEHRGSFIHARMGFSSDKKRYMFQP